MIVISPSLKTPGFSYVYKRPHSITMEHAKSNIGIFTLIRHDYKNLTHLSVYIFRMSSSHTLLCMIERTSVIISCRTSFYIGSWCVSGFDALAYSPRSQGEVIVTFVLCYYTAATNESMEEKESFASHLSPYSKIYYSLTEFLGNDVKFWF